MRGRKMGDSSRDCETCEEVLDGQNFGCEACDSGVDSGNYMCMDCSMFGTCSVCRNTCCIHCVRVKHMCCGKVLCGSGVLTEDDCAKENRERMPCIRRHGKTQLECGHPGCNFHDGCYTCELKLEGDMIEKDRALVMELLDKASSQALKAHLQRFLADPNVNSHNMDGEDEMLHDA